MKNTLLTNNLQDLDTAVQEITMRHVKNSIFFRDNKEEKESNKRKEN